MFARKVLKVVAFPSVLLLGHSGYVFYQRELRNDRIQLQKNNPFLNDFRVGTMDDIIMDHLQTGDIILFKRKWYMHYFPVAIALVCYRVLFQCDYDHIGIVLIDKTTGKTYVLENTLFNGVRNRLFSDRISYSQASMITLVPLVPREMKLPVQPLSNIQPQLLTYPSEFSELLAASRRKLFHKYFGGIFTSDSKEKEELQDVLCPNFRFVTLIYRQLGIEISFPTIDGSYDANLQYIFDYKKENMQLERGSKIQSDKLVEDQTKQTLQFDPNHVQIRSR